MKQKWLLIVAGMITLAGVSAPIVLAGGPSRAAPAPAQTAPAASGTAQTTEGEQTYVALGDSAAAGAGIGSSAGGTNSVCDRSARAYPARISRELGTKVANYACTGAKFDEGIYGAQTREDTELLPQLDKAFMNGTPDIMTITGGANDVRWAEFMFNCIASTCGTTAETYATKVLRADMRIELYYTLAKIRSLSGNQLPEVYISGYYMPVTEDISCMGIEAERFTADEYAWIKGEQEAMNTAIQQVVEQFDFATYVPLDFSGKELCSDNREVLSLASRMPLHPTRAGQQTIADAFVAAMR